MPRKTSKLSFTNSKWVGQAHHDKTATTPIYLSNLALEVRWSWINPGMELGFGLRGAKYIFD